MSNLLAVLSSLTWGVSDYVGGVTSRRVAPMVVVLWSQMVGLAVAISGGFAFGGSIDSASALWGAAAGLGGGVGLAALYHGLATGRMAIVAPTASLIGAGLPVVVGLTLGERPGPLAMLGILVALPAIWLTSRTGSGPIGWRGVAPAVIAGAGFAAFFVFLDRTGDSAGLWPLVPARMASVGLMAVVLAVGRRSMRAGSGVVPGIVVAGAGDMIANMLFLSAVRLGLLSVVSVLSSLYPVGTVVLARVFGEDVSPSQWLGVGLSMLAVGLIAV